ncbi:Prolyl tripeptidyl peptidase precursor [Phycisphaerae bacterium RAS1]|nr:Prolyl tripeptidyl peptidase precursor [Phycisphaerae bacterium RAS1]
MHRISRMLACSFLLTFAALAADPPTRAHDITIDDYFTLAVVGEVAASPDGKLVAYTDTRWEPPAEDRNTEIWIVATDGASPPYRLTFDPGSDGSPQWGPDSQHLYFAASRKRDDGKAAPYNGKTQVWATGTHGGEPLAITRLADGIGAFQLAQDGRHVYYTTSGEDAQEEWKELRGKHKDVTYVGAKRAVSELWRLDMQTWRAEKLVAEKRYIRYFAVSPDQQRIAMITDPNDELITHEGRSRVDVYDAATKKVETLADELWRAQAPSPYGWLESAAWSSDGRLLAFTISFDGYPSEILLAEWKTDAASGAAPALRRAARPADVYVTGRLQWIPDSADLCFVADQRARRRIYCLESLRDGAPGKTRLLTPTDIVVDGYAFSTNVATPPAVILNDPKHTADVFLIESGADPAKGQIYKRLTNVNPQVDTWKLPQVSTVTWKSRDGVECEGILELPHDYEPGGGKLPLIVELHGGPTDSTRIALDFRIYGRTSFPAAGYAVFSPNYRGSTGYGDKFLTDLIGHENDIDVADILTGVDALIERGIADPDKLGVMGWSNGGFLTNCLITTTTRFKAASSGAGVVDQFLQWAAEDTPGHVLNYMRGFSWTEHDAYRLGSPSSRLGDVKTPTLIHVGGDDARVPAIHSRALHRALREYVNVPCELLVYPGQGHGLTKCSFRKAKMEWDLAWMERYVRRKPAEMP